MKNEPKKNTANQTNKRKHVEDFHDGQIALAKAVKEAREATITKSKVTQEHLAEKSLLESESIKRIEREEGNPQFSTLYPVVKNLKINPYKIFYAEEYNNCPNLSDLIHYLYTNCSDADAKKATPFVKDFIEMLHSDNTKNIE